MTLKEAMAAYDAAEQTVGDQRIRVSTAIDAEGYDTSGYAIAGLLVRISFPNTVRIDFHPAPPVFAEIGINDRLLTPPLRRMCGVGVLVEKQETTPIASRSLHAFVGVVGVACARLCATRRGPSPTGAFAMRDSGQATPARDRGCRCAAHHQHRSRDIASAEIPDRAR